MTINVGDRLPQRIIRRTPIRQGRQVHVISSQMGYPCDRQHYEARGRIGMIWAAQIPGTVCRPETTPSAHLAHTRVRKIYRRGVTSGTDTDVDRCVRQISAG